MNIDILEISVPRKNLLKKKSFNNKLNHFLVHQCNFFWNMYKNCQFSKHIKWFENKLNNLYGYRMQTYPRNDGIRQYFNPLKKKFVKIDLSGPNSNKAIYLRQSMNFTYSYTVDTTKYYSQ